jgi:hypothetical protein
MVLENIPYDILIHTSRQRSADKVGSHKSPERGSRIAQGYKVIQMTINHMRNDCSTNSSNLWIWEPRISNVTVVTVKMI